MSVVFICSPHLSSYVFGHNRLSQQDAQYANVQVELRNSGLCFIRITSELSCRYIFAGSLEKWLRNNTLI